MVDDLPLAVEVEGVSPLHGGPIFLARGPAGAHGHARAALGEQAEGAALEALQHGLIERARAFRVAHHTFGADEREARAVERESLVQPASTQSSKTTAPEIALGDGDGGGFGDG